MYVVLIGVSARCVWLLDPFYYFDWVPTILRLSLFWVGTDFIFGGAVLAYAVWLEVVLKSKKLNSQSITTFKATKIGSITFVIVELSFFAGTLIVSLIISGATAFDTLMVLVAIAFTIAMLVLHFVFLPTLTSVAKQSISIKVKDIHRYINWMVFPANILNLVFGGVQIIFQIIFPLTSPYRLYSELTLQAVFRTIDLVMLYFYYQIVLYEGVDDSSFTNTPSQAKATKSHV
eukprot:TRINITY_DN90_c0_g2_i2.p1 TRINITY_DN90_c0_g2~~TRINITY_DN90_c0_g2_i2.p1  ORF type:complete len:232 (+),score=19.43 TRINITY_DN90_c0_g2_i2:510-1205(+)